MVNIFSFAGHAVIVLTTQLYLAVQRQLQTNGNDGRYHVPIKLYLHATGPWALVYRPPNLDYWQ